MVLSLIARANERITEIHQVSREENNERLRIHLINREPTVILTTIYKQRNDRYLVKVLKKAIVTE